MTTGPNHLPRIDILRAVAIWMVFNSHFANYTGYSRNCFPAAFSLTVLNGGLGVSLFFVISGLCIRLSHLSTSTFSTMHFYWRRFWRIYPAYLLALVLIVLIKRTATSGDITAHVFLLHNFSTEFFKSINAPFWSLALEFQVYLLYPILLAMHNRLGPWLTGGALFVVAAVCHYLSSEYLCMHFQCPAWFALGKQLPLALWFTWYLGFLIANALVARKAIAIPWRVLLVVSTGLLFLCKVFRPLDPLNTVIGAVVLALLVWEFLRWNPHSQFSLFGKAAATVGACSYSFYLYHDAFITPCLNIIRGFGIESQKWLAIVSYPLIFLLVSAFSFAAFHLVEMPSLALGRRLYDKWLRPQRVKTVSVPEPV